MQVTGMHASGWNTWAACMWKKCMQEYKQMARMWAGKCLRASGKKHTFDEPPRRHAQVKGTPNQHRGGKFQEQIKKHISAFLEPRANCKKEQNNLL
jgi:hypothetical protein